jgi:hypothetical protein
MNAQELSQYLADAPPSVVRLEIKKHFDTLSEKQQRYAHFISRYVWHTVGRRLAIDQCRVYTNRGLPLPEELRSRVIASFCVK